MIMISLIYAIGAIMMLVTLVIGTVYFKADKSTVVIALMDSIFLAIFWPASIIYIIYIWGD